MTGPDAQLHELGQLDVRQHDLPPGQRRVDGFPRFGTHLHRVPPPVPDDPAIEVSGALTSPFSLPVSDLATLPRHALTADFHCVAGWSATDLHWEGVPFEALYRRVIEPALAPGASVSHLVFGGLDGFESLVAVEDALRANVLVADRLDGKPLDGDHGAPARLVSPDQYGYVSTKHLSRIEVHTRAPRRTLGAAHPFSRLMLRGPLVLRHPRARVWQEERHPHLPGQLLRPLYRVTVRPGRLLSVRRGR